MDDLGTIFEQTPFGEFSDRRRDDVIFCLSVDGELRQELGAIETFHLLLVLYGVRPACIIGPSAEYVESREAARVQTIVPDEYFAGDDTVGEFLERFNIPYTAYQSSGDRGDAGRFQISRNYYVSFDEESLDHLDSVFSESSRWGSLTEEQHTAIGQFLGFPQKAIEEWCESYEPGDETLLDQLSDKKVLDELSPFDEVVQTLDVDPCGFAKCLLPYIVPVSAKECRGHMLRDIQRYLIVGIHAWSEYDTTLLSEIAAEHKVRYQE